MNLEYLKAFYLTVQLNSISKAAKELHLTQPGLSLQLQSLERSLEVTLLIRSNRGVKLTEAGQIVYDYADTILSMQDNIDRDLKSLKSNKKELLLGSCKAIGEFALPCSIYVFKQGLKDLNINFEIKNTEDVVKKLLDRTINLGIIHGKTNESKLKTDLIATDRLVLVTSLPLMKDVVSFEEFLQLPLILREHGSGTLESIKREVRKHNVKLEDLNIVYELNSMEAIKNSVLAGKGIAFIPELSIKRNIKDGDLKEIQVDGINIENEYYIAYRDDHELDIYEKEFIRFIKSSKRGFC